MKQMGKIGGSNSTSAWVPISVTSFGLKQCRFEHGAWVLNLKNYIHVCALTLCALAQNLPQLFTLSVH